MFDGQGRTLWADPTATTAAFTPDGTAFVTVSDRLDLWFLPPAALSSRKSG